MTIATKSSTIAIAICFPVIGAILCITRFLIRRRNNARLGPDDYLALFAWVVVTGACASLLTGVYIGAFFLSDTADADAVAHQEHAIAQITGATVFLWFFANASIKLSILFFYRRIFRGPRFNIVTWVLIGASCVWLLYSFVTGLLYCGTHIRNNFEGPWDVCPAWAFKLQLPTFITDALIDFCILLIPMPFLLKLRTTLSKKISLVIVFGIGGFAFVAGLLNTIYQFLLLTDPTSTAGVAGTPPSPTSNGQLLLLNWPVTEIGVGLIACNLPTLSMLTSKFVSEHILRGWESISDTIRRLSNLSGSRRRSREGYGSTPSASTLHSTAPQAKPVHTKDVHVHSTHPRTPVSDTELELDSLDTLGNGSRV